MEGTARVEEQCGVAQASGTQGAGSQAHGRPGPARRCHPRKQAPEARSTAHRPLWTTGRPWWTGCPASTSCPVHPHLMLGNELLQVQNIPSDTTHRN